MDSIQPDIAVVIPLYNKEETIGRALKSVTSQKLLPAEVIVVDDGSTDDSLKTVREFAEKFHFLKWFSQENGGVSSARNAGAAAATARTLCFLDADDAWEPGYLEEMARLIDRKSTRLNSSHVAISYAVFCLK